MRPRRTAKREDLGLTPAEFAVLQRLDSPQKIQAFLFSLGQNFEVDGDTCLTVRGVLETRRAHCIEGAMLAACAFWVHGEPPLLLDMRAVRDFDHVVALFRRHGRWGALSKTNGIGLRSRDPVYGSLRELAMSYFHEYHNALGERSLREYSRAFDLRRLSPELWVSGTNGAWEVERQLDGTRHYRLFPSAQDRLLSPIDAMERKSKRILEYPGVAH